MRWTIFLSLLSLHLFGKTLEQAIPEIIEAGRFLNGLNLCPATSGNFSVRLDNGLIAVTVSGKHKGELTEDDVMLVDAQGAPYNSKKKPSAETLMHTVIYSLYGGAGAVLHTHSVNGCVLSRLMAKDKSFITEGYEMHKAFGIPTHESTVVTPIFENSQNYPALAEEVRQYLQNNPNVYGFFLRDHGLYTWGRDMKEAKIRVETFEYLFESELKFRSFRHGE